MVSRAGWPDQLASDHTVATLGRAALLHAGRPTVVTVGAGACRIGPAVAASPEKAGVGQSNEATAGIVQTLNA